MRVICAPDSFKESLSATAAATAMRRGVLAARPDTEVDVCPVADGGEGTLRAIVSAAGGEVRRFATVGPLGQRIDDAPVGFIDGGRTAVIEMAVASGLELVPSDQRDPTRTTTIGTGLLIKEAMDAGARRLIVCIGGSATNDGGVGMAMVLGFHFFDAKGGMIAKFQPGRDLSRIARIESPGIDISGLQIDVACDVTNPLTGPQGAAATYGPQKGATPEQVKSLDEGLANLARVWRQQLGVDVEQMPGAGAAGGLGAGLVAFLGAKLQRGIDLVLDAVRFDERAAGCDLCLTGEGRLDGQSLSGKACIGVARRAANVGVPTVALVGSVGPDAERTLSAGLRSYHVIGEGLPASESMARTAELLERVAAEAVGRL